MTGPYDIAISPPFDADPLPYAAAGATWWLPEFEPDVPLDTVRGVLRDGPANPGGAISPTPSRSPRSGRH